MVMRLLLLIYQRLLKTIPIIEQQFGQGEYLQVTLMSINVGDDIGLEIHPQTDQFLRIEQGQGLVQMGENPNHLNFQSNVFADSAIMIPANTWHNVINTGPMPLKLYSIYAPPHHPYGTVQETKADAMES